ncbi:MFS general substrate transporter [Auriculariales sp. MPI-PUGE-AT-0066]|nr:MFS general substrate transporter [Auriculariales sp. MPI-PUGE-AT-0066]
MIILIYVMNYIDRTAIASARIRGLEEDLHLTHFQFETAIAILYASYCPMQIPSNLLLNKTSSPRLFIGGCVIAWGLIACATGLTRNFHDILICRFLIGIPEAAFYPGVIYLLSRWYSRTELALRSGILYAGLLVSNALGSLMAAGILSTLEGIEGISAWRWLFFVEGGVTVLVGIAAIFVLPDYPENTLWLSEFQRRLAQARLAEEVGTVDQDSANEPFWHGLVLALKDEKTILFMWLTFFGLWGLGFTYFFPTIAATLGYDTTVTLLIAAPPWVIAAFVCVFNARHADLTGERFFHIVGPYGIVIIGYILAMSGMQTFTRYAALFFLAAGNAGFAVVMVWVSNSIPRPPSKRAAAIALVNGFGNLGNVAASYTWKAQYFAPAYRESCAIGIAALAISSGFAWVLRTRLIHLNEQLAEDERKVNESAEDTEDDTVLAAGRLQGISVAAAVATKKAFRYLY